MIILIGVLCVLAAALINYLILALFGISFHSFKLWFILPVGGLIEGSLCGIGIYVYLIKKELKAKLRHYFISALLGFIGFWLITFFNYASTYVHNDEINNTFTGEHISNYMYSQTEPFTFGNYLKYEFENTETEIRHRGAKLVDSKNFGEGFNKASFYISMVGFMIGGMLIGLIMLGNKVYCEKCKKYMKSKKLYEFDISEWDYEVNALLDIINKPKEEIMNFFSKNRVLSPVVEAIIEVKLTYCDVCKDGFITLMYMQPKTDSSGKVLYEENPSKSKTLKLEVDTVTSILFSYESINLVSKI